MQIRESSQSLSNPSRLRAGRRVLVNVTSLIDVVFLLLIFFMVSSTFLEQPGMKLDLPSAKSADISQVKSYILYVFSDGKMTLNDKEISMDHLSEAIQQALPQMADMSLSLFADKSVQHGQVVKIMDIARQAGVKKLVVATIPDASEN